MVATSVIKNHFLSKNLLYKSLSLLLSKTSKSKKSYISYIIITRQAVCLISIISRKNYLQINAFQASSDGVKRGISNSISESSWESVIVEYKKKFLPHKWKLLVGVTGKVVREMANWMQSGLILKILISPSTKLLYVMTTVKLYYSI